VRHNDQVESRREKARWAVTTLLLGWVLSIPTGLILAAAGLFDLNNPVVNATIFAIAIVGAILLRLHWESVRSWMSNADEWLYDHPVFAFASYVLAGIYLGLLWHSLAILFLSVSLWGLLGGLRIRSDRRRRGNSAA
jgi:hypothetical protein